MGVAVTQIDHLLQPDEAIAFLRELVQINSVHPGGDEAAVAAAVARKLAAEGIPADVIPLGQPRRANALGRLAGGGRPGLVFSGHLDVVPPGEAPWRYDPWSATVADGRLYGRGSIDMKGGLAAQVMAVCLLRRAGVSLGGDLWLAATAGEESDLIGARAMAASGGIAGAGGVVVGEPTGLEVIVAHRGVIWLDVITHGHTAHASVPHQGVNALAAMGEALGRLAALQLPHTPHPALGGPTVTPTVIRGGTAANVVPDRCELRLDIRTVPGQTADQVIAAIAEVLRGLPGPPAELVLVADDPPGATDPAAPLVQAALAAAADFTGRRHVPRTAGYFTELAIYQPVLQVPVVVCGPGNPGQAHQPNEHIILDDYLEGIRFFAALAVRGLGTV